MATTAGAKSVVIADRGDAHIQGMDRFLLAFSYFGPIVGTIHFILNGVTMYNIYFGASAGAIGLLGIIIGFYNALNGMPVARLADAGWANKFACFPLKTCGRRGPFIAVGVPILAITAIIGHIRISTEAGVMAFWFAFYYFNISNGFTLSFQSILAVVQETMLSHTERAKQTMMGAPFEILGILFGAGVMPAILFNNRPDSVTSCCVQPLTACQLGCACIESALVNGSAVLNSAFVSVQIYIFIIPPLTKSIHLSNTTLFYITRYI